MVFNPLEEGRPELILENMLLRQQLIVLKHQVKRPALTWRARTLFVLLESSGFTVLNLGVDVSAEAFAQAVRDHKPQLLGLPGLLTTTMLGMEDIIEDLKRQGLRDQVKVIIDGAPVSKKYAEQIGANGFGNDAAPAVKLVRSLL